MADEIQINPGLARRIDLLALTKPRTTRRRLWFAGFLTVWTLIGAVASAVAHNWATTAVLSAAAALAIVLVAVIVRAERRVPETKRWLDELSGRRAQ